MVPFHTLIIIVGGTDRLNTEKFFFIKIIQVSDRNLYYCYLKSTENEEPY